MFRRHSGAPTGRTRILEIPGSTLSRRPGMTVLDFPSSAAFGMSWSITETERSAVLSRREFDGLEICGQDNLEQFDVVGIIHDQVLDPGRLGPATARFHQGLALAFHVGFYPAFQDIDHLKVDVVEMQF